MIANAVKHESYQLHRLPTMEEDTAARPSTDLVQDHQYHHRQNAHDDEDDDDERTDDEPDLDLIHSDPLTNGSTYSNNDRLNRRTVRKLDFVLLPFLALLFLLNSMDKSNIGNAETAGFTHDAGISRQDINQAMAAFFFVFVLLQPFSAALGRRFGMRRWVPACMTLWGLMTILHIWVHTKWQLVLLRVTIAILESGTYPTTVAYLSLFYTRFEFGVRLGFFYSMTAVSGALGGVLSWAVFSHIPDGDSDGSIPPPPEVQALRQANLRNWQVLFLIEGCMTITIALVGFFYLPASADTAWFFSAQEKAWADERIRLDKDGIAWPNEEDDNNKVESSDLDGAPLLQQQSEVEQMPTTARQEEGHDESHHRLLHGGGNSAARGPRASVISTRSVTTAAGLTRHDIVSAVYNYNIWHLLIVNILSAIPATAFGVLLPILVEELSPSLNLSAAASNLLSAPPFAFGALVLFGFTTWSDRSRQRLIPILGGLTLLLVGLIIAVTAPMDNYWLRYAALCVLLSGSFIASPLTVAWLANNTPEPGKRAILLGINGWGNLAGVFIIFLFTPEDRDDGYIRSFIATLACVLASFAGFIAFWILIVRENKWRDDVTATWTDQDKEREELVGDAPVPDRWLHSVAKRLGIFGLAERLGLEDIRVGDDKLTYRYGF